MVAPGSPVPRIVGSVSLVTPLSAIGPIMLPTSSSTSVMVGINGETVSTVRSKLLAALVLPAASVAVMVK